VVAESSIENAWAVASGSSSLMAGAGGSAGNAWPRGNWSNRKRCQWNWYGLSIAPAAVSRSSGARCACLAAATTGLVFRAVLVGLEEDAIELVAHRFGAAALHEVVGPGFYLQRLLLLALDAQQGGLDGFFGRLPEQALAQAAEVMRRFEQRKQGRGLLFRPGVGVEVVARQLAEAEIAGRCEFPRQVEVDLGGERLRLGHQFCGAGLGKTQHHVGRLDLDALARIELDLQRGIGFLHHAARQEFAGFVEQNVHGSLSARRLGPAMQRPWKPLCAACVGCGPAAVRSSAAKDKAHEFDAHEATGDGAGIDKPKPW
jgi:hypothetical protein